MVRYRYYSSDELAPWKGPVEVATLREMLGRGEVSHSTRVVREGLGEETTLGEIIDLPPEALERARLSSQFLGGSISWFLLTVGQLTAILACLGIVIGVTQQLEAVSQAEKVLEQNLLRGIPRAPKAVESLQSSRRMILITGVLSFCLTAALVVVFKRAKAVASAAAAQDEENRQLWRAIGQLRGVTPAQGPSDKAEANKIPGTGV